MDFRFILLYKPIIPTIYNLRKIVYLRFTYAILFALVYFGKYEFPLFYNGALLL